MFRSGISPETLNPTLIHPGTICRSRPAHVDHKNLFDGFGELTTGPEVTAACLSCHEEAGEQMLHTAHWKWESEPVEVEGREGLFTTGKKKSINNFCIGIQGNWASCTACHAGYGWDDADFDFNEETNIDCLVCHDNSGTYRKGKAGLPLEGVDLMAAARVLPCQRAKTVVAVTSVVVAVTRSSMVTWMKACITRPRESMFIWGVTTFQCVDCHQTKDHVIGGRSTTVSLDNENQIACTDCHNSKLHTDDRINAHTDTVACQACHVPEIAVAQATKTHWDWSKAGDDFRDDDVHHYLKIKGEFIYEKNLQPEYRWYNGLAASLPDG